MTSNYQVKGIPLISASSNNTNSVVKYYKTDASTYYPSINTNIGYYGPTNTGGYTGNIFNGNIIEYPNIGYKINGTDIGSYFVAYYNEGYGTSSNYVVPSNRTASVVLIGGGGRGQNYRQQGVANETGYDYTGGGGGGGAFVYLPTIPANSQLQFQVTGTYAKLYYNQTTIITAFSGKNNSATNGGAGGSIQQQGTVIQGGIYLNGYNGSNGNNSDNFISQQDGNLCYNGGKDYLLTTLFHGGNGSSTSTNRRYTGDLYNASSAYYRIYYFT